MNAPADIKIGFDRHPSWAGGLYEIVKDPVRNRLMEGAFVTVAPEIKLQAFQLNTEFVRKVSDSDRRKVRLSGLRTQTGEFRTIQVNLIIATWIGVLEYLEIL